MRVFKPRRKCNLIFADAVRRLVALNYNDKPIEFLVKLLVIYSPVGGRAVPRTVNWNHQLPAEL